MATVMLSDSNRSMISAGRGMTMTMRTPMTPMPIRVPGLLAQRIGAAAL